MQRKAQSWFWNGQVERRKQMACILMQKTVFLEGRQSYRSLQKSFQCSRSGREAFLFSFGEIE